MPEAVEHARGSAQRGLVPRTGLLDRLSGPGGVALVCAPAGSGKTVLVRSWVQEATWPTAWVSVERGERDAQRFWLSRDRRAALARRPGGGARRSGAQLPRRGGGRAAAGRPARRSTSRPSWSSTTCTSCESAEALRVLEVLLARLPPALRVVLATREDPRLGLHRLRLAGELIEIRAARPAVLARRRRASCCRRRGRALRRGAWRCSTSGPRAGRPACGWRRISLARHPDPERFVTEFSGSERTVADYLMAEVLERQPSRGAASCCCGRRCWSG